MMIGRIQVPPSVKRGEPFEVKILVQHPMETGFRRDLDGQAIPTNIVDKMTCTYGGREVFGAELGTGFPPIRTSCSGRLRRRAGRWSWSGATTGGEKGEFHCRDCV
jgi:sulfur-oxidizing protein SoxZ